MLRVRLCEQQLILLLLLLLLASLAQDMPEHLHGSTQAGLADATMAWGGLSYLGQPPVT
jgi:hypothetical protein